MYYDSESQAVDFDGLLSAQPLGTTCTFADRPDSSTA